MFLAHGYACGYMHVNVNINSTVAEAFHSGLKNIKIFSKWPLKGFRHLHYQAFKCIATSNVGGFSDSKQTQLGQ